MKVRIMFPFDPYTLGVIKEIEAILDLPNKNCSGMSRWELMEYINQLTIISIFE